MLALGFDKLRKEGANRQPLDVSRMDASEQQLGRYVTASSRRRRMNDPIDSSPSPGAAGRTAPRPCASCRHT